MFKLKEQLKPETRKNLYELMEALERKEKAQSRGKHA